MNFKEVVKVNYRIRITIEYKDEEYDEENGCLKERNYIWRTLTRPRQEKEEMRAVFIALFSLLLDKSN